MKGENVDLLKDAIIAEVASDVLKIRDELSLISPLVTQMKEAFPASFDALQAGLIETLELINEGIKEAGGERIEFVKGQLSVFIEQAIQKAFAENSEKVEQITKLFEKQNNAAALNLRAQFDEVSEGMGAMREEINTVINKARFPTWVKIGVPVAFVFAIACSSVISWQLASYKEAVYMNAFMKNLPADKGKSK